MVSPITQSGIERMKRLHVESENPVIKTTQDKVAIGILIVAVLVLFSRYNRKNKSE